MSQIKRSGKIGKDSGKIPRKVKQQIDGDLAEKVQNGMCASHRLRQKLWEKQNCVNQVTPELDAQCHYTPIDNGQSGKQQQLMKAHDREYEQFAGELLEEVWPILDGDDHDLPSSLIDKITTKTKSVHFFKKQLKFKTEDEIVSLLQEEIERLYKQRVQEQEQVSMSSSDVIDPDQSHFGIKLCISD